MLCHGYHKAVARFTGVDMSAWLPAGTERCPICHDPLGHDLYMLPCGHQLCCRCSLTLVDRAPNLSPEVRRVHVAQSGAVCSGSGHSTPNQALFTASLLQL